MPLANSCKTQNAKLAEHVEKLFNGAEKGRLSNPLDGDGTGLYRRKFAVNVYAFERRVGRVWQFPVELCHSRWRLFAAKQGNMVSPFSKSVTTFPLDKPGTPALKNVAIKDGKPLAFVSSATITLRPLRKLAGHGWVGDGAVKRSVRSASRSQSRRHPASRRPGMLTLLRTDEAITCFDEFGQRAAWDVLKRKKSALQRREVDRRDFVEDCCRPIQMWATWPDRV